MEFQNKTEDPSKGPSYSVIKNQTKEILSMDPIVFEKGYAIEKEFSDLYEGIVVIGSFAVGEFTKLSNEKYHSDIDFYIILKPGITQRSVIEKLKSIYNLLNSSNIEGVEPTVSIWLNEYSDFYSSNPHDTLVPYQILETGTVLFGSIEKGNLPKKIEFNSHIGLCGVGYMQLLKGLQSNDIVSLSKAVFNQIGSFLISKEKYQTSYRDRIDVFFELFPEFLSLKNTTEVLYEIKKTGNIELFREIIGNKDEFLKKVEPLFELNALNKIFSTNLNLKELGDTLTQDGDTHKYIRVAYFCLYLKDSDLAMYYLQKACDKINYDLNDEKISLDLINNVQQNRVKTIGVFD